MFCLLSIFNIFSNQEGAVNESQVYTTAAEALILLQRTGDEVHVLSHPRSAALEQQTKRAV